MADYRGGTNDMSPQIHEAIRNIRAGDTPAARRRALTQKVIVGGVGALLEGTSALVKHEKSKEATAASEARARKATLGATEADIWKQARGTRAAPVGGMGEGSSVPTVAPEAAAKTTMDDLRALDAGDNAPVFNQSGEPQWNPKAFKSADMGAESAGRDINTARDIMRQSSGSEEPEFEAYQNGRGLGRSQR